jgi:bifunctional non-homologous end joining protein LigD
VAFQEWTSDGIMRQPIFLGLRDDKAAGSVRRERPATSSTMPGTTNRPAAAVARPVVTNPEKVYWPDEGYTKADLVAYYRSIAPVILPHLRDRPLSLNRHPNGITEANFFQKNVSKQPPPAWVTTAVITSKVDGTRRRQVVCQDEATLVNLANLGCIEMNPWTSRVGSLDRPDYVIIDLDPHEAPFTLAVEAAREVHRLLRRECGECFCKTSGKRGLHVYVPLGARYDHEHARQFAEIVARLLEQKFPDSVSLVRDPNRRKGKLYVDYLQNRQGQTTVAVYSARPVAGATVATPLRWSEVTRLLDPRKFTIRTVPRRVERLGDLWAGLLGAGTDLGRCLAGLPGGHV